MHELSSDYFSAGSNFLVDFLVQVSKLLLKQEDELEIRDKSAFVLYIRISFQ